MKCTYCGDEHDVKALCRARGVSRRRFLFLGLGAAAAAVLPAPTGMLYQDIPGPVTIHGIPYVANAAIKPGFLYGRVRMSKQLLEMSVADRHEGAFIRAQRDEWEGFLRDLQKPDSLLRRT